MDLHLLAIPVVQGDVVLERRDATDLGALRDYRVESRNPPQEREAERDRSHPAYLAERWIRESGIHAHLADDGGCQAQATFQDLHLPVDRVGRASGRERVCKIGWMSVVAE